MSYGAYDAFDDLIGALNISTDSSDIGEQTEMMMDEIERLQKRSALVDDLLKIIDRPEAYARGEAWADQAVAKARKLCAPPEPTTDTALEEGTRMERAFSDGNDLGG